MVEEADIKFSDEMFVDVVDSMGSDARIVAAARVSTVGSDAKDSLEESSGLINFLLKNRHGSPFEHGVITFRVTAPIFVWREHHRHRIASYNEESGRYTKLKPHFYVPSYNRPLVQEGRPGHYQFVAGTPGQVAVTQKLIEQNSVEGYRRYEYLLEQENVAKEVSRMTLPVNVYSTCYVTMNVRALMNFLSLRTKVEGSMFPSYPQREIEMVAEKYEVAFKDLFPQTFESFCNNGRVAP